MHSQRDHRVDFLRGLALASIFINHVPGNLYERLTHKNFGFSDAAEVFVLLAGFASAYAYFAAFQRGDRLGASWKALKRAGVLYVSHIVTTVVGIALLSAAALYFGRPAYVDDTLFYVNLRPLMEFPLKGFVGLAAMGHQLGYFNILPMYMILLAMLPAMMWLAARSLLLLGLCSVLLYVATGWLRIDVPNYPLPGGWFFNPFSWQLLFVLGFTLGQMRREGKVVPYRHWLLGLSLLYLALAWWWLPFDWLINHAGIAPPSPLWSFDKTFVALPRLLHVLALAYAVGMLLGDALKRLPASNPFAAMGRHSLPVFCIGSLLSIIGTIARTELGGGVVIDTVIIAAGLILMAALARFLDRERPTSGGLREPKDFASVAPAPTPKDVSNAPVSL